MLPKIQSKFPKTTITSVDCKTAIGGLCEVTAGKNLFYASPDGRYLLVGAILDLDRKIDLTDERLKQLAAVESVTAPISRPSGTSPGSSEPTAKMKVDLPLANAIVHNPGAPIKISVFSDFNCGYCRMLFAQLIDDKRFEVSEYPVAFLGAESESKARIVLCAKDRPGAARAAYANGSISNSGDCAAAAAAVAANTRFAKTNGIEGTPTIVRADGTVHAGYLAPEALKAFSESKS